MKLPAGYGQIVKLGGKRRRPWAARVDDGDIKKEDGRHVKKVKYLGYFEKKADALDCLARYNAGIDVIKQKPIAKLPTFEEVYEGFMDFYTSRNKEASGSALQAYKNAFKNSASLHNMKFVNIRADTMQDVIREHACMSQSSCNNLMKLFHGMYKYALRQEIVEKDYSSLLYAEYTKKEEPAHIPFTDEEIAYLWDKEASIPIVLIYTGMRKSELAGILNCNVHLSEHYMTGGVKTAAGKNRVIPLHKKIEPIIENMLNSSCGEKLLETPFQKIWNEEMKRCGMNHKPHDSRHTTASLMERFGIPLLHRKLILGHAVNDITEGVYTHVPFNVLVDDINRITL